MKFVFLTNQASYHQMHFARAMADELGADNFRIVFQKPTSAARAEMGWRDDYKEHYILRFWQQADEVHEWIAQADVVIQGRFPIKYLQQRIKGGKLTFACQERLWKKRPTLGRKLSRLGHFYKNYISVNRPNYHFLAIGHYAAKDLNDMGFFKGRSWQYGYFIDAPKYQSRPASNTLALLWCARFSEVKQPRIALEIVQGLKQGGVDVTLTMIGDGDLRADIEQQIKQRNLDDQVRLVGWQTQDQVSEHMKQADLFLMTSHHGEGWGLVVNEAMSFGAAVIANAELGSAACLIDHGKTGLLYQDDILPELLRELVQMPLETLRGLGKKANNHMLQNWSSAVAAQRTIALATILLNSDLNNADWESAKKMFSSGPGMFIPS
jgi:glycosyltransferase involved in cell wall biosynthesis